MSLHPTFFQKNIRIKSTLDFIWTRSCLHPTSTRRGTRKSLRPIFFKKEYQKEIYAWFHPNWKMSTPDFNQKRYRKESTPDFFQKSVRKKNMLDFIRTKRCLCPTSTRKGDFRMTLWGKCLSSFSSDLVSEGNAFQNSVPEGNCLVR